MNFKLLLLGTIFCSSAIFFAQSATDRFKQLTIYKFQFFKHL